MSQFCLRERTAIQSKGRIAGLLTHSPLSKAYMACV